jgi:hypothetical protein
VSVLLRFEPACTNPLLSQIPALLSRVGKLYRDENGRRASEPQFPLTSLCQHCTKLLLAVWYPTSSAVTSRRFSVVATAIVATCHCSLHLGLERRKHARHTSSTFWHPTFFIATVSSARGLSSVSGHNFFLSFCGVEAPLAFDSECKFGSRPVFTQLCLESSVQERSPSRWEVLRWV